MEPASGASDKGAMSEEERERHLGFMREALSMARLALSSNEVPVGCVFVHNGAVVGRGMNDTNRSYNGTRHAEFMAINDILSTPASSSSSSSSSPDDDHSDGDGGDGDEKPKRGGRKYGPEVLRECDLYVTIEPCIMCASLLRQMGVRKVFFGGGNERFGGTGGVLDVQRGNGRAHALEDGEEGREREGDYEVSGGWLREEAIVLLRRFYVQDNERGEFACFLFLLSLFVGEEDGWVEG
ncbi:cytidine deaminase-like protein [Bisporella sp. PMI_857]|nr:cytidine deaminase-like protein [Bisporella sp. PMI_857]